VLLSDRNLSAASTLGTICCQYHNLTSARSVNEN